MRNNTTKTWESLYEQLEGDEFEDGEGGMLVIEELQDTVTGPELVEQ